uniref:Uncharacterized protein n=1 Tax=Cacopsylla melanoneura TaxID=428564 RepID=A0A8D9BEC6_9HEMI
MRTSSKKSSKRTTCSPIRKSGASTTKVVRRLSIKEVSEGSNPPWTSLICSLEGEEEREEEEEWMMMTMMRTNKSHRLEMRDIKGVVSSSRRIVKAKMLFTPFMLLWKNCTAELSGNWRWRRMLFVQFVKVVVAKAKS